MKKREQQTNNLNENLEDFNLDETQDCATEEPLTAQVEEETCQNPQPEQEHECSCGQEECCKDENCSCHQDNLAQEYLAMAQRLQADFDNYRKRVAEQLDFQRLEGVKSVLQVFLPCLDTFKEAKKSITDENVLAGVNMIEDKILSALKALNVEKIEAVGQVYDPHLHNVIAVMRDESQESDIILEEYQSGWKLGDKVIKYSQVVVNKLN